jgi:hypothetical protein
MLGMTVALLLAGCGVAESDRWASWTTDQCAQLGTRAATTKGAAQQGFDLARRRCERGGE